MRTFIGPYEIVTNDEALELALELSLGPEGETDEECAARLAAARDIFEYDPELLDRARRVVVEVLSGRRGGGEAAPAVPDSRGGRRTDRREVCPA